MSSYIVDRRLNSKNKSTVNRQRFLKRYRKQIRKAVSDAVNERKLEDMENGDSISIPKKDLSEPVFSHGKGGNQNIVHPGNKDFVVGDRFKRPEGGEGGSGEGEASDSGEGEDEFVFQISQEEFLEFMFEDLALPNMIKLQLSTDDSFSYKRAGISEVGSPNQVNVVRSLRSAQARRIALGGKKRRKRRELREELAEFLEATPKPYDEEQKKKKLLLEDEIASLTARLDALPYIDEFDLKFNLRVKIPQPSPKAVMFCVLDVSGSMTQEIKDTAKRFFYLLYLFLHRSYEKIDVVFIRHHTKAEEVSEEDFFYSRETGGTVVSSALELMNEIIKERYPADQWNIYGAQASDGDNWQNDTAKCHELMTQQILPAVQYFTYIEIGEQDPQELWRLYTDLKESFNDSFALSKVRNNSEIFPVFRELFKKEGLRT
ncbi:YeaH/YhbH family protein [Cocleimonas sp. KMM 6892]|uniref:YeaH/YhbH family protein n=1 Tax=unclassified Cocleimonas TaxID=2639732 RepID=UPI002DBA75AE|nr:MULTISPECIES: YeaH/YhbH family protein [unclassified Cocleimonas]MEB8431341.1 YeaH/YhbH family protein [Cocleimonas sp. KMM 6892]MEC4713887.1 YeaH/YhbH family protein [Cocleimonas sp. KMM 6895]MEC4743218.1 YeaH/YhbH family protein [Cocleimonas sp. KMM 6896]